MLRKLLPVLALLFFSMTAMAGPVRIEVSVLSNGAKFIGDKTGGAQVTLRDEESGEVIARGVTRGSTGSTEKIMQAESLYTDITSEGDAVFVAEFELDAPRRFVIEAEGPLDYPQALQTTSRTLWIVPGQNLEGANRVILGLAGYIIDPVDVAINQMGTGRVRVDLQMLCGCAIIPGGTWDARRIHKHATLVGPTGISQTVELEHIGDGTIYQAGFGGKVKHPRFVRFDVVGMDNENVGSLTVPIIQ